MPKSTKDQHIILASASPRRSQILTSMGVKFTVICADTDEASDISEPSLLTQELARRKGAAVYSLLKAQEKSENAIIISADTVVACNGEILGKPKDEHDARRMLEMLSGNTNIVVTGVAVTVNGKTHTGYSTTKVYVDKIPPHEIEAYIASKEPFDKAGAYGIQGSFSKWIQRIDGCYFGVVGLPINCLCKLFFQAVGEYPDRI